MTDEATKQCPYCAETIKAAAVVCRFCGRDLTGPLPEQAPHVIQTGPRAWSCSVCGKAVLRDAAQCNHCRTRLIGPSVVAPGVTPAPPARPPSPLRTLAIGIAVAALLIIANVVLPRSPQSNANSAPTFSPDRYNAWADCQDFVKKGLKSPSTAEFPSSSDDGVAISRAADTGRWSVAGYVDAQNAFGAMIRESFNCQLSYNGDRVTVHKLRIGDQTLLDN